MGASLPLQDTVQILNLLGEGLFCVYAQKKLAGGGSLLRRGSFSVRKTRREKGEKHEN